MWSLLRGATWWLPLTDSFLFQGPLPTDDQTMIATLGGLRKELEKLTFKVTMHRICRPEIKSEFRSEGTFRTFSQSATVLFI